MVSYRLLPASLGLEMPILCTTCAHPSREEIDRLILGGRVSNRRVAAQFGLSEQAVRRHRANHIPSHLAQATAAAEVADADALLGRLQQMLNRCDRIMADAEKADRPRVELAAMRELRFTVEVLLEAAGELDRGTSISIDMIQSSEWHALRSVILRALEPFPDAARAVAVALEAGERTQDP